MPVAQNHTVLDGVNPDPLICPEKLTRLTGWVFQENPEIAGATPWTVSEQVAPAVAPLVSRTPTFSEIVPAFCGYTT